MGYRKAEAFKYRSFRCPQMISQVPCSRWGTSCKSSTSAAPMSATPISMAPPQDQAAQLQKILDFVSSLINPSGNSQPLGQVNGALGETIGNMLDGKKTAIGAIGSLLTAWLSSVPALPPGTTPSGLSGLHPTDSRVRSWPQRLYHAVIPCPDGLGCTRQAREMGPGHRAAAQVANSGSVSWTRRRVGARQISEPRSDPRSSAHDPPFAVAGILAETGLAFVAVRRQA